MYYMSPELSGNGISIPKLTNFWLKTKFDVNGGTIHRGKSRVPHVIPKKDGFEKG